MTQNYQKRFGAYCPSKLKYCSAKFWVKPSIPPKRGCLWRSRTTNLPLLCDVSRLIINIQKRWCVFKILQCLNPKWWPKKSVNLKAELFPLKSHLVLVISSLFLLSQKRFFYLFLRIYSFKVGCNGKFLKRKT